MASYTDASMSQIERVGIPTAIISGDRPASIEAKKTYHSSPAENDDNAAGATIRFTLPCSPNTYLMPDVNLTFDFNNTVACCFDLDASCLIERYRLFHGSQLLVDIPEYGRLSRLIEDVTQSPENGSTVSNLLKFAPTGVAVVADIGAAGRMAGANAAIPYPDTTYMGPGAHHCVVPLMCPLIGTLATKAFPGHAATAAPLRVEIDLVSNLKGVVSNAGGNVYNITTTQLQSTYVQVSSQAQSLIDAAVGGVYSLNTSSYAHSQANIAAAAQSNNILLPFSYSSLKHVVTGLYPAVAAQNSFNISGRGRQTIDQVFYQIGASRVPSAPMNGPIEVAEHLCKCFGVSTNLLQISNYLTRANFTLAATVIPAVLPAGGALGTLVGKFAMGLDLEAWGATSSATRIENGINTTALQMYLNFTAGAGLAASEVHTWGCYDMLVSFTNGSAYARF